MTFDHTPLPQQVVVYDKPGQKRVVYGTAYTQGQVQQVITRARSQGRRNVRALLGKDCAKA